MELEEQKGEGRDEKMRVLFLVNNREVLEWVGTILLHTQ